MASSQSSDTIFYDFPPGRDPMGFAERKSMMIKVIEVLKDDSLDTKAHLDAMTALKIIR